MPRMHANGVELYYEISGPADADVLVLSNGILMSTASWGYQTKVLSRYFRVLTYDCRGMWQSEHPAGPYSMQRHAEDLAALLDGLGIQQAHIGGISYGGEVSLAFALAYPQRTTSLIVSSSVATADQEMRTRMQSWFDATQARDPEALFAATAPFNFTPEWAAANPAVIEAARGRYAQLDFAAFGELLGSFSRLDLSAALPKISAPALVLVGEKDILKPPHYSREMAERLPNAEFALIPGAGHAVSWEKPGVFNSLLLGFVLKHAQNRAVNTGAG